MPRSLNSWMTRRPGKIAEDPPDPEAHPELVLVVGLDPHLGRIPLHHLLQHLRQQALVAAARLADFHDRRRDARHRHRSARRRGLVARRALQHHGFRRRPEPTEEAADLIYHIGVALEAIGSSLDDVARLLFERSLK